MRGGGRHIFTEIQIMVEYRTINMEEYPRREHFRYFSAMPVPTFGITARADVTGLVRFCRERRCSFYMRAVDKLRAGEHAHNESG